MARVVVFAACLACASAAASVEGTLQLYARQLITSATQLEQRIRSTGGSGLTQVRAYNGGTRSFHDASYINSGAANIHNHANNKYTIGMGEIAAVLNGAEFWSRHNDYQLRAPHSTSNRYNAVEDVLPPEVPPAVLEKATVEEQTREMQEWFLAFKEQNHSVRDYRPYFKPVLSYLEGTWIKDYGELKEPFASDRHHIDAKTWNALHEKTRFLMASGSKNNAENLAQLPSRIMSMTGEKEDVPETANFEYTIKAVPIPDLPVDRLKVHKDMVSQMWKYPKARTTAQLARSRDARFQLNAKNHSTWFEGHTTWELMDDLMALVPGKDNYNADITDHVMGDLSINFNSDPETKKNTRLNTGFYSRYYGVGSTDASGRTRRKRGFNDGHMWAAQTTQPKVAGLKLYDGYGPVKCPLSKECIDYQVKEMARIMDHRGRGAKYFGVSITEDDDVWRAVAWNAARSDVKQCPNHDRAAGKDMLSDTNYHSDDNLMCRFKVSQGFRAKNKDNGVRGHFKAPAFTPKDPSCGPLNPPLPSNTQGGRLLGDENWKKCPRDKTEQKWSWAIPLEIIYMTPLMSWNPYNLKYWDHANRNKPSADGRTGSQTDPAKAFNGNSRYSFYQTPAEFFNGEDKNPDAADTVRGAVGVLDEKGEIKRVSASGTWITFPKIANVGEDLRQRYPVFPLHVEGSTIWKELKAFEAIQLTGDEDVTSNVRLEALGITFELTFAHGHVHTLHISGHDIVTKLENPGDQATFTSSLNNGHEHQVTIKRAEKGAFEMVALEPAEPHHLVVISDVGETTGGNNLPGTQHSKGGSWGNSNWGGGGGSWGNGEGGGGGGGGGSIPPNLQETIDNLVELTEKQNTRIASLEAQLKKNSAPSECADMDEVKSLLADLTQAVATPDE